MTVVNLIASLAALLLNVILSGRTAYDAAVNNGSPADVVDSALRALQSAMAAAVKLQELASNLAIGASLVPTLAELEAQVERVQNLPDLAPKKG
jgi:hypothetical protein